MYGIHYQLIVCMLVVLIMFKNKIDKYLVKLHLVYGQVTLRIVLQ